MKSPHKSTNQQVINISCTSYTSDMFFAQFIQVTIVEAQLECERDHLLLYNGPQNFGPPLASICVKPHYPYNSSTPQMSLAFVTDATVSLSGFHLSWEAIGMSYNERCAIMTDALWEMIMHQISRNNYITVDKMGTFMICMQFLISCLENVEINSNSTSIVSE